MLAHAVVCVDHRIGLGATDVRGSYGYHLVTAMALLLADALYHTVRATITAILDWHNPDGSEAAAAAATAAAASSAQEAPAAPVGPEELAQGLQQQRKKKRRFNKNAWKREALRILESDALSDASSLQFSLAAMERALRQHIFMSDAALSWVGIVGYIGISAVMVAALPALFSVGAGVAAGGANLADARGLPWYFLLVCALLAAVAAFANSRGGGAVDINLAESWAKFGLLVFGLWAGSGNAGSVGSSLLCGGVMLGATSSALNAMYAWRAGYMTMTSPTAIFVAYMVGLGVGCVLAPAAWLLFDSNSVAAAAAAVAHRGAAGLLGPDKFYASPLVAVFRSTAALATGGMSALPRAAQYVGLAAFVVGIGLNLVRDSLPVWLRGVVPNPAAVGVVFLSGANVAVDVVVGAAIRVFWRMVSLLCTSLLASLSVCCPHSSCVCTAVLPCTHASATQHRNTCSHACLCPLLPPCRCCCVCVCCVSQRYPRSADAYNLAVGCALIAGEGLWGLGKGLLAAFGVAPPICMSFTPAP